MIRPCSNLTKSKSPLAITLNHTEFHFPSNGYHCKEKLNVLNTCRAITFAVSKCHINILLCIGYTEL